MIKSLSYRLLIVVAFAATFFSCKKERDEQAIIKAIQQTGELVTVEYNLSKIIKANDNKTWFKIGDRKILMSFEANVKAGVDLQQITANDITTNDDIIDIQLPPAKVFSLSIPPEKIKLHHQEVDFLRSEFTSGEREKLLAQGEAQIKRLIVSLGIIQTAEKNAAVYIEQLLQQTGFEKVNISFKR